MRIGKQISISIASLLVWAVSAGPAVAEYAPETLTLTGAISSEADPSPVAIDAELCPSEHLIFSM